MKKLALIVAVMFASFASGCGGQASQSPEKPDKPDDKKQAAPAKAPANVPDYTVTKEQETSQGGQRVKAYSLSTDAESEKDLKAITLALRDENPNQDALVISFYPNEPMAEISGAGYAFQSEEAAKTVLGPGYTDENVAAIMQEDGLLVISMADTIKEITEETTGP